jgi:SAM-dependent methyltransferase
MPLISPDFLEKMRIEWDERARENALHFVHTGKEEWDLTEFLESGKLVVEQEVLTDMGNICQGRTPDQMHVLEIGCGVGRITRALSEVFGDVHAVDVSGEMIAQAQSVLADRPNAHVYQNNGKDLAPLKGHRFDFAFSYIVLQHISSRSVIESYMREVGKALRPGALFKFQLQGNDATHPVEDDTWLGVPFRPEQAREMAIRNGFELRYFHGENTQYFWLWFFKRTSRLRAAWERWKLRVERMTKHSRLPAD